MSLQVRDRRQHSPVNTCVQLAKRAKGLGTDVFDAELAHLRWLANRMVEAEREGGESPMFVREFGLQLRATTRGMADLEAEMVGGPVLSDEDWKLSVVDGGRAGVG